MPQEKASLLDTSVILRFLLDHDPDQSARAHALMRRLEKGQARADLEDCVLAEVVWVLEKGFEVPRGEITRRLSSILEFTGLRFRGKKVALEALRGFGGTDCDIVDCLLAAHARSRRTAVSSFDSDFKKLGCRWSEPL